MQDNVMSSSPAPEIMRRKEKPNIAYHGSRGKSPGVIFLGGFGSNMEGSKATALEQFCQNHDRSFLRFDYSGHGVSSGSFEKGCISEWAEDAIDVLDELTTGPQVLVGSSMGGWIMFLVALARPERIHGLLGIATAPDFTEDSMWAELNADQRTELLEKGLLAVPNDYDPYEPYIITKKLIEDGQKNLLLRDPLNISVPVRLIQGMQDADVPWATALKIQEALVGDDVEIQFVKNGDHRLSKAPDLQRLKRTLNHLLKDIERS